MSDIVVLMTILVAAGAGGLWAWRRRARRGALRAYAARRRAEDAAAWNASLARSAARANGIPEGDGGGRPPGRSLPPMRSTGAPERSHAMGGDPLAADAVDRD